MRKAMLCMAVIGLASLLWAADPSVGTWKINAAKSKLSPTSLGPKEGTLVIRELGADEFELTLSGVQSNGSKVSEKMTWSQKGGVLKSSTAAAAGESNIVTMIAPGEWYTTYMKDGKQTSFLHSSISKDGKTMTVRVKGTDEQGKPVEEFMICERQ
jgi:hypothetical protein